MRSKLFVPGSRPELFSKSMAGPADAISVDLEDSVEESRKDLARHAVSRFLSGRGGGGDGKTILVRINGLASPHFSADLDAVVGPGLDLVNLPMAESADDVRAAAAALDDVERAKGIAKPFSMLVNIETPRALERAAEIAAAHPRVVGLQLGFADMFEPLGIDRSEPAFIRHVQLRVRLAAGSAGIWAYDSAFADVSSPEKFRREAEDARRMALGKSCIHPTQVPVANETFMPTRKEIDRALKVLEASRKAEAAGFGAYMVDGQMVDPPFVRSAENVVGLARRLDLLPSDGEAA